MGKREIIKNMARCRVCGDIIESKYTHDFVTCSCGRISVDGGRSYLKRSFTTSMDDIEELSVYSETKEEF